MQSLEQSCRKASDVFTGMADIVSTKKSKKFCYEMSLALNAARNGIYHALEEFGKDYL